MNQTKVFVEFPDGREVRAGTIIFEASAGRHKPVVNFEYWADYLADDLAYGLSPDMPLVAGFQEGPMGRPIFAAFADAQPDAWGRKLISAGRRQAREPAPHELDFLLAVSDVARQGALRFSDEGNQFLAHGSAPVADIVDLNRLVNAAADFERGEHVDAALRVLLPVGSTQGGARPKAVVRNAAGRLAIAKLPSPNDAWDAMAWEAATADLSRRAGIAIPDYEHHRTSENRSVFVTERFDRTASEGRIGYLSVRSLMLAGSDDLVDYATLAETIGTYSERPNRDPEELFRRAAFSTLVSNLDDHTKNHGVLRGFAGWNLAPAFDVNPNPYAAPASMPLSRDDDPADRDIRNLLRAAPSFRLTSNWAVAILREVENATSGWPAAAARAGIAPDALESMSRAFETSNRERVQTLTQA